MQTCLSPCYSVLWWRLLLSFLWLTAIVLLNWNLCCCKSLIKASLSWKNSYRKMNYMRYMFLSVFRLKTVSVPPCTEEIICNWILIAREWKFSTSLLRSDHILTKVLQAEGGWDVPPLKHGPVMELSFASIPPLPPPPPPPPKKKHPKSKTRKLNSCKQPLTRTNSLFQTRLIWKWVHPLILMGVLKHPNTEMLSLLSASPHYKL